MLSEAECYVHVAYAYFVGVATRLKLIYRTEKKIYGQNYFIYFTSKKKSFHKKSTWNWLKLREKKGENTIPFELFLSKFQRLIGLSLFSSPYSNVLSPAWQTLCE